MTKKSDPAQSIHIFINNICKVSSKLIETINWPKKKKQPKYILKNILYSAKTAKAQAIFIISQNPVNEALD